MSGKPSERRTGPQPAHAAADRRELLEWATLGAACTSLLHDLNNHLNSMLLQAASLQIGAAPTVRTELEVIRREGMQAAARLRPLQQFRGRQQADRAPVDLNHVIHNALALLPDFDARAELRLAETLAELPISATAVELLIWLTLRAAWSCRSSSDAPIWIRTLSREGRAEFVVDSETGDDPPSGHEEMGLNALDNVGEMERLAMQSIVRETAADLRVVRSATGGIGIRVSWKLG